MSRDLLTDAELDEALASLPLWTLERGALRTRVTAADFSEAFGFMSRVALAAEAAEHHPDWSNSWATVDISLRTHDRDGITGLDVDLARRIDGMRPDA